ncbi:hypothetical protein GGI04_001502 [Coemansia thaxteri]|uniref:Translation initiation factor beta propellor-like domain-containing protein n=1 Tax=Coemansia thaxteri TaxID=2663907 RepID=A0A9W8BJR2_9FUNG|nr:hypothetical protein H4R26_002590 [Coemansia thaxteri]KAJ2007463.1 hypothetical protein GGI04_001502 [Coemansia thaxteri]KAJ2474148.1 hypothetical protein GGI02_000275 [Coemansia sp. RSA 2322]KAJ2484839.1 hypothetical protein EV174_002140 [Coemansia sp. RSA 2320]
MASQAFQNHKETRMHWEQGAIYDLSWSGDGGLLTAAGAKGPVRSWRLERGGHKEGEELKDLGNDIERLAWCPALQNPHTLAAAAYEKCVYLWDQRAASVSAKLATGGLNSDICWSPSGKYLAVVNREESLEIFDMANSQAPVVVADLTDAVACTVKWDTSERLLLMSTHQGNVEVYAWPSMEHLTMIPAHAASCNAIGVDPRARFLATGGADAAMNIWSTDDYSIMRTVDAHESPLLLVDFSYDGRFIASASDDLAIRIHDSFSGDRAHQLAVSSLTTALEWHPRNLALAYGSSGSAKASIKPTVTIFLKS